MSQPHTLTLDDVEFDASTGKIERYTADYKDIVIPDNFDDIEVAYIAHGVFKSKALRSVKIPDTVTFIGELAFADNALTSVTIPNSVLYIGNNAFFNNALTIVDIPANVMCIASSAFKDNSLNAEQITVPHNALIRIADDAFGSEKFTRKIKNRNARCNEPHILTLDDVEFNRFEGKIESYKGVYTNIEIPTVLDGVSVNSIGDGVFETWRYDSEHDEYGESVYSSCCEAWKYSAEYGCECNDEYYEYDEDHEDHEYYEDDEDDEDDEVCCGECWIEHVKERYSWTCSGLALTHVIIPNSVTYIGRRAFKNNALTSVVIPNPDAYIENGAFDANPFIKDAHRLTLRDVVFDKEKGCIIKLNEDYRNIVIPSSFAGVKVNGIGKSAFADRCLYGVVIPHSVMYISDSAFYGNDLKVVFISNATTKVDADAFDRDVIITRI